MSVHKSQGSEFLHTALLLPPTNPIFTHELVYTGIIHAREWLTLIEAKRGLLNDAVKVFGQKLSIATPGGHMRFVMMFRSRLDT